MRIRNFNENDFVFINQNWIDSDRIQGMSFPKDVNDYRLLIQKWNTLKYRERYFEQFIIIDNDVPVGICSIYEQPENAVSFGVIIDKKCFRKGYCTYACSEMKKIAKEKGYSKIVAGVNETNKASIDFCKNFGFRFIGRGINKNNRTQYYFEMFI